MLGLFAEVLNPMDSAAVDRFIAPDYIQHSQLAPPGREALKSFLDMIRAETPQAVHDVKRAFVDGDHVTVHYHVRRWPDDKGWAVIDIFRIEAGHDRRTLGRDAGCGRRRAQPAGDVLTGGEWQDAVRKQDGAGLWRQ